jgi:hypothetical protein
MSEAADRAGYTCVRYGHWWLRHQDSSIRYCKICGIHQLWTPAKWEEDCSHGPVGRPGETSHSDVATGPDDTIKYSK